MSGLASYDSRTALITGGSSGIGLGLAEALVERDARVALIGTDAGRLDAAVAKLTASGGVALGVVLDVTDRDGWPGAIERVEAELAPIDILILNAGAQCRRGPIEDTSWEEWHWLWDVNVHGVFHGLKATLPGMKRRGRDGHVLITASIGALTPRPHAAAYGASKAAALALGEALRLELQGSPIRVSVMCPAGVRTNFAATSTRHAPGADANSFAFMQAVMKNGLDPLDVGRFTLDAMADGQFYIFTHPETAVPVDARLDEIRAAFPVKPIVATTP